MHNRFSSFISSVFTTFVVFLLLCCVMMTADVASASGFLNWARYGASSDITASTTPFFTSNVLTSLATSAHSDVVVSVSRTNSTNSTFGSKKSSSSGKGGVHMPGSRHPFAPQADDDSNHEDPSSSTLHRSPYHIENNNNDIFVAHVHASRTGKLVAQFPTPTDTTVPSRTLRTPWDTITILHNIVSNGSIFNDICSSADDAPVNFQGEMDVCGIMLSMSSAVRATDPTTPPGWIYPLVWVKKDVKRRVHLWTNATVTASHIPLVPTVDDIGSSYPNVVPWKCGRIVTGLTPKQDLAEGNITSEDKCLITSPEQITSTHRGCDPPLGTLVDREKQKDVSTTVMLRWNGTLYIFRPLELALRTLGCLSPSIDPTAPVSSKCSNYADLIYVVSTTDNAGDMSTPVVAGFSSMVFPLPAKPPPWVFLDQLTTYGFKCLLYTGTADGNVSLYDVGSPLDFSDPAALLSVGDDSPPVTEVCQPTITSTAIDMIYSVNTSKYTNQMFPTMDGIFTTATSVFTVLCNNGVARFYLVSPTVNYFQTGVVTGKLTPKPVGTMQVPFPKAPPLNPIYTLGDLKLLNPQRTAVISINRIGALVAPSGLNTTNINKEMYNSLATSCIYTVALAVPSTGYRGSSDFAIANNKSYGNELDSYVSIVTSTSTYTAGFQANVGESVADSTQDIFGMVTSQQGSSSSFSFVDSIRVSNYYDFSDIEGDDTYALLQPKDYYVDPTTAVNSTQFGPPEMVIPIRERITAILGFINVGDLPAMDFQSVLSAEIDVSPICGGDTTSTLAASGGYNSALLAAHQVLVNSSATWLLEHATALSVTSLMISIPINVSSGHHVKFKNVDIYTTNFEGNVVVEDASSASSSSSSSPITIPPNSVSLVGGTSFAQQLATIDPYDGMIGDVAEYRSPDIWLAPTNDSVDQYTRLFSEMLTAADLFPIMVPFISSQAVSEEYFEDAISTSESEADILEPQNALTYFLHDTRLLATLPRSHFFPTIPNNKSISSDLPVLTVCAYQLSDNGVSSITALAAGASSFLAHMSATMFINKSLYVALSFPNATTTINTGNTTNTTTSPIGISYLSQATALQLHLGNSRYGTRRLNTQIIITKHSSSASTPPCATTDTATEFHTKVAYGQLVTSPAASTASIDRGARLASNTVIVPNSGGNTIVSGNATQYLMSMYIQVGGVVAITQSYCFQPVVVPAGQLPYTEGVCGNGSSLTSFTFLGATVSGVLVGQQTACQSQFYWSDDYQDNITMTGTIATMGVAYSAQAIVGTAPITLNQPFGNATRPFQWRASDRHQSSISGGNVTSMASPTGSNGNIIVCQGSIVLWFSPGSPASRKYDTSLGASSDGTDAPCPVGVASCSCYPGSIVISSDYTVVQVTLIYTHVNQTQFNGSSEMLVIFFSFEDLSLLGYVLPETIRTQMRGECPDTNYADPPIIYSQLASMPIDTLREIISTASSSSLSANSKSTMMSAADVIMGIVAPIPNTRCIVVWIIARNQLSNAGRSPLPTAQTFVYASMARGLLFTGHVATFPGIPFISLTQKVPMEFECFACTPQVVYSVGIDSVVEAIVGAYKPMGVDGNTTLRRYDFPFGIVPSLLNTSMVSLYVSGQYRISIQAFPEKGDGDRDPTGCYLNRTTTTDDACSANFSQLFVFVSDLYSEPTTPPLYGIDLVACNTIPKYTNTSSKHPDDPIKLLLHPPVNGNCKLLYNEPRRNIVFKGPQQGLGGFTVLADSVCFGFGTIVCLRVTPIANVTTVILGTTTTSSSGDVVEDLDMFYGFPVKGFSGITVFNSPNRLPMALYFPLGGGNPTIAWLAPWWPESEDGVTRGADFTKCSNFDISDTILTLMCEDETSDSTVRRMAIIDAGTGQVLAASGPYGSDSSVPLIGFVGTFIMYINNLLSLSITFLNVRHATVPLNLTTTVCSFSGNTSYSIYLEAPSSSGDDKNPGFASVVRTSRNPGTLYQPQNLTRAIRAPRLVYFSSTIGNYLQLDASDANDLFGGGTLPGTENVYNQFRYSINIADNSVTLAQVQSSSSSSSSSSLSTRRGIAVTTNTIDHSIIIGIGTNNTPLLFGGDASSGGSGFGDVTQFYVESNCYACMVVPTFSTTPQVGQCPSICTVEAATGVQYRYTPHATSILRQVKPMGSTTFSDVADTTTKGSTTEISYQSHPDPNVTVVGPQFVYALRKVQDIVPCVEGGQSSSATQVLPTPNITFCRNFISSLSPYTDIVSLAAVSQHDFLVLGRELQLRNDPSGLITCLQFISKRPVYTVDTHASVLYPIAMSANVEVVPIGGRSPYETIQSATIVNSTLIVNVGGEVQAFQDCDYSSASTSMLPIPTRTRCAADPFPVGVIGGTPLGSAPPLPLPSKKYLSVQWSDEDGGGSRSLWGTGYVRTHYPVALSLLMHAVPTSSVATTFIEELGMSYRGGQNDEEWSSESARKCYTLPPGNMAYDGDFQLDTSPNATADPTVICPTTCAPDYEYCNSMTRHFMEGYLYHSTRNMGISRVMPTAVFSSSCNNNQTDAADTALIRLQLMIGYLQQESKPLSSDWIHDRVAEVELYCTEDRQVIFTATIPEIEAYVNGTPVYTYKNAKNRVLLRKLESDTYDAALGISFTCTHCMYFMLEGISAQPFIIMLLGSIKGLLTCYIFYFFGRLAEKKKRLRMTYVVTRGDLVDRLEAVKWILSVRREELRARKRASQKEQSTESAHTPPTGEGNSANNNNNNDSDATPLPPSDLDRFSKSLKDKEHIAANDGLFSMTTAELLAEKQHIRQYITGVELAYQGTQLSIGPISRFLNRVIPNPIDLAIFLLLRLLSFKKQEDMVRVRKVIARTFSSATLSRSELAAHVGVILSGSQCRYNSSNPFITPAFSATTTSPPTTPTTTTRGSGGGAYTNLSDPLVEQRSSARFAPSTQVVDKRWYAFAKFFAEHLTSEEHVWMVKHTLDTPPPLQSEKATLLQNAELRRTHLLLNAIFVMYSALMNRVAQGSGSSASPTGLHVVSRRRNASNAPDPVTGGARIGGATSPTSPSGGVSIEAAVAFFKQEVTSYAKEWLELGCMTSLQQSSSHFHKYSQSSSTGGGGGHGMLSGIVNRKGYDDVMEEDTMHLHTPSGRFKYEADSDASDAEELQEGDAIDSGIAEGKKRLKGAVSVIEQQLQFQMDTLLMLRAHKADVSFAVMEPQQHSQYPDDEGDNGGKAPRMTKVRFTSHIEESYTPPEQSEEDEPDANVAAPLTSSNFVKSIKVFQSKMRDDGETGFPTPPPPPPTPPIKDTDDATSTTTTTTTSTTDASSPAPHMHDAEESPQVVDADIDLEKASLIIVEEHDSHFNTLSTADMVLQLLRFSHEFNSRIEDRQTHFDFSKMYTQQLDEALAPNAFLIVYGIVSAVFSVFIFSVEVIGKAASEQDSYTVFEIYQCIFFRFVNTTTFPTLLVDIFARADQLAKSPSSSNEDGDSFFGRLIPLKLGGGRGRGAKSKATLHIDKIERRTFIHRARSIASDKLLLVTMTLFSLPMITHILPGCVLYAWLLLTPVMIFIALESWISNRLDALDSAFVEASQDDGYGGESMMEGGSNYCESDATFAATKSTTTTTTTAVTINDIGEGAQPDAFDVVTAEDVFMPVLRNMQEEEANMSMMAKLRQYLDPTTTVFVVRSLLRVVLIFLLMVVLSASYTYMAVYVYARGPLLDTHGGITSYERTGSYSSTSYLGAIVTDYMGRSIECVLEGILKDFPVMIQTGIISIF